MVKCYRCNQVEVAEEYTRCPPCEAAHRELCAQLDAKPKMAVEKVREELFPVMETKQGIKVITWISREDAANMGIQVDESQKRYV